jgi:peptidoglycan-associated lipoprotein
MIIRLIPALSALLLLAACAGGSDGIDPNAQQASAETGGPIDSTMEPNPAGGVDGQALPGSAKEFETTVGNTVHFDTDSYSLNAEAQASLQKQAAWLQKYPQHTVTIEGHADERGTREYNLALGDRRATTVMNYLAALGIDKGRLSEVSYGKEKPVCVDASDSCWNENRRGVTALSN